jgi:hypothetical protein
MTCNYVGSSTLPVGKVWPNAYAQPGLNGKLIMIARRSSTDQMGTWYSETGTIDDDLKYEFGEDSHYLERLLSCLTAMILKAQSNGKLR